MGDSDHIKPYLKACSRGFEDGAAPLVKTLWQTACVRIVGADEEVDFALSSG